MVFLINKKGWIRLANHSASERLLVPQDQLLLSNLKNLVVTQDAEKFDLFLNRLFSHRMAALETKLTNFSGRKIIVEFVAASLRRSSEEERLACCFARDLTKRKRMEQELIVSERLATIGKMAAGVAHEVNNPIGIILAHAEDLISGELDQSETQESLNAIRRNALRAGNITRAMLEQASTEQSEKIDLDISVVLKECLDYLKPRLKKISVIRQLKTDQYWTQGDENQLQQVFINLFLNAVESMSGAGVIRVSVDRVEKDNTIWYRIRIEDSGKGIPAHQRQQIFDPFFTKGKSQGVGLGLFVATRIIKNHGGNIFVVDSDLGGVTMNVDLPAKAERKNGNPSTDS
jgi:PAS domain S-box-containing protein